MLQRIALFIALFCLTLSTAGRAAAATPADIDAYIEVQMRAAKIPGMAVAIIKDGQVVHTKGYGITAEGGRPSTPQTPFILGSTSKSFTAMAILQLAEAGKLSLDAPVRQYLPWFTLADEGGSARITVRHLLNQTSGISRSAAFALEAGETTTREAVVRQLSAVKPTGAPGAAFEYSNANYITLGLIVETVSGQEFGKYVQEHIFAPLGMKHSHTSLKPAVQDGLTEGHQYYLGFPVARTFPYKPSEVPAGFIISSAEDMGRYLLAVMKGGQPVLSAASVEEMHRPAAQMGPDQRYGMGWWRETIAGVPVIAHAGEVANGQSYMVIAADKSWGVVLLANSYSALFPDFKRITDGVVSLMAGKEPPQAPSLSSPTQMLLMNALLALGVVRLLWSLFSRKPVKWRWVRVGGNLALGGLLLAGLPALTGLPWSTLIGFAPDIAFGVIAIGTLSLVVSGRHLIAQAVRR